MKDINKIDKELINEALAEMVKLGKVKYSHIEIVQLATQALKKLEANTFVNYSKSQQSQFTRDCDHETEQAIRQGFKEFVIRFLSDLNELGNTKI